MYTTEHQLELAGVRLTGESNLLRDLVNLIPRTNEANYVRFVPDPDGCRSNVGMMGGEQQIQLAAGCNTLHKVVPEIGHAVGLLHEQGRSDRDAYLNSQLDNVQSEKIPQFEQQLDGTLVGTYDYESVMQYPWTKL